jgi:hypothetical protein
MAVGPLVVPAIEIALPPNSHARARAEQISKMYSVLG